MLYIGSSYSPVQYNAAIACRLAESHQEIHLSTPHYLRVQLLHPFIILVWAKICNYIQGS